MTSPFLSSILFDLLHVGHNSSNQGGGLKVGSHQGPLMFRAYVAHVTRRPQDSISLLDYFSSNFFQSHQFRSHVACLMSNERLTIPFDCSPFYTCVYIYGNIYLYNDIQAAQMTSQKYLNHFNGLTEITSRSIHLFHTKVVANFLTVIF